MKIRSKRSLLLFAAMGISLLTFFSCEKRTQVISYYFEYTVPNIYFNYPSNSSGLEEVTLYTGKIKIPLDSILSSNHINGEIKSATIIKMSMVITDPPDSTFDWLSLVRIIGCADSTFVPSTNLVSQGIIDPKEKTIHFSSYIDLTPVLVKESCYIKLFATPTVKVPSSSVRMYLSTKIALAIRPLP